MKITVKLAINHHQPDLQAEMGYGDGPSRMFFWAQKTG